MLNLERIDAADLGVTAVLTLSCPDRAGIVHAVSGFLMEHDCNILESQQYEDADTGTFFMRVRFGHSDGGTLAVGALADAFAQIAQPFGMAWRLVDAATRVRTIIMVSQYGHCLNDLLFRNSIGDLSLDVVAVVSNHEVMRKLVEHYELPFFHIPVSKDTKSDAERQLMELVGSTGAELVILARYMQILSETLCERMSGRVINIHHSMLPSFKGARPYHQAHARGVKFIGATAHYVTSDLDEGPIIEQEMVRIDHSFTPDQLAAVGRKAEAQALATAVRWHTENRVVMNGARTVVLG